MTQRQKLEFEINKPLEIELMYDEPVTGKSAYGDYFLYAVKANGQEWSYFPPREVHDVIRELRRGDKAVITKLAAQRGSKIVTTYDVKVVGRGVKQTVAQEAGDDEEVNEELPARDSFYGIMLSSYRDAIEISRELNGMADPEKIAVTLFIARSRSNGY
ncbi:MAG: hypothetical protein JW995_05130 [Melioribacteraceae bacterium]|nr:hypothetical protein [Melioribacteraceae bacterium]